MGPVPNFFLNFSLFSFNLTYPFHIRDVPLFILKEIGILWVNCKILLLKLMANIEIYFW